MSEVVGFPANDDKFQLSAAEVPDEAMVRELRSSLLPEGWKRAEVRGGALAAFCEIAKQCELHTPIGDATISTIVLATRVREIIQFYSGDSSVDKISVEDALAFLDLQVYGGGIKKWIEALTSTRRFETQDKVLIGTTSLKRNLKRINKKDGKWWERPFAVSLLFKELAAVTDQICECNPTLSNNVCEDLVSTDGDLMTYQRQSRIITLLVGCVLSNASASYATHLYSSNQVEPGTGNCVVGIGYVDWKPTDVTPVEPAIGALEFVSSPYIMKPVQSMGGVYQMFTKKQKIV